MINEDMGLSIFRNPDSDFTFEEDPSPTSFNFNDPDHKTYIDRINEYNIQIIGDPSIIYPNMNCHAATLALAGRKNIGFGHWVNSGAFRKVLNSSESESIVLLNALDSKGRKELWHSGVVYNNQILSKLDGAHFVLATRNSLVRYYEDCFGAEFLKSLGISLELQVPDVRLELESNFLERIIANLQS